MLTISLGICEEWERYQNLEAKTRPNFKGFLNFKLVKVMMFSSSGLEYPVDNLSDFKKRIGFH